MTIDITPAQLNALRFLYAEGGEMLTSGMFGNTCANLCKKGLATFNGNRQGKRVFMITQSGRDALYSASIKPARPE